MIYRLNQTKRLTKTFPVYTIKNWSIFSSSFLPPTVGDRLQGNVYGNPKFPDGYRVTTGYIESVDAINSLIITESGSRYQISPDDIDPIYAMQDPNAYNRLFGLE